VTFAPPTGVTPGLWALIQAEIGPYGSGPEPTGTETTNASVVTRGFDPAVTSSIGDAVAQWTFNGAAASIAPTAVDPGTSSTFTVHIAPTAAVGTTVSGTLFVNGITTGSFYGSTITFESIFASDIAAIPYQYTVSS
jgi:hypothetical protein